MNILFVHQNFPGKYLHLAPALGTGPANRVVALGTRTGVSLPGVQVLTYKIPRKPGRDTHPWIAEQEVKVIRGEAVAGAAMQLRSRGFSPDVICAHPGWGEAPYPLAARQPEPHGGRRSHHVCGAKPGALPGSSHPYAGTAGNPRQEA